MVETKEARRCVVPSSEWGKKSKGKERNTCKKKGNGATCITPGAASVCHPVTS